MVKETFTGKLTNETHGTLLWVLICCFAALLPVISAQPYSFHLQEESPTGTTVGTINIQQGETYTIDGNSGRFALNSQNGIITTTSRIDRDSLSSNPIILQVRTSSSSFTVRVQVDDINDNTPEFPSPVFPLNIFENVELNTEYAIDTATDTDAAENGTVDYSIISGNEAGKFKLGRNATECVNNGFSLCLITQGSLDREDVSVYQINISASDRGKPTLRAFCLVNITVVDLNDNDPEFTKSLYNATVDENTPAGVSILTVSAADKDQASNGKVTYYFQTDVDSDGNDFQLNSTTGVIRTKAPLDYEVKKSYTFQVIARDQPAVGSSRQTSARVKVNLRDVNDNTPEIEVFYINRTIPAKILESALTGTHVATVRVKDGDDSSGPSGSVNMKISNGNGSFELTFLRVLPQAGGSIYRLSTATLLDRERFASYNITVTARDNGIPSLNSSVHVLVSVIDVNDEVPTFSLPGYSASISEQAQNGSSVYWLSAVDSDAGANAQISYSILSGNAFHWFQIDSTSGLISTTRPLDRERLPQVSLTVLAEDHGLPPLNSTTIVTVVIHDINDNNPKFSQPVYNVTLHENRDPGTPVTTVQATDDDVGPNGNVTYKIDSTSQDILDTFNITASTGILFTKVKLDREVKSTYDIPIIASDHGVPPRSSRTLVQLRVLDENDNHPTFYPITYVKSVLSNTPPSIIARVTATDADAGTNGQIIYAIVSGGDDKFAINSSSGVIRTLTSLDSKIKGFYKLNITARDVGGLSAQQTATVEVTVQGQSDDPPEFQHKIYNFSVYENVPSGTYVGKVIATTKANNASIQYTIVSGDPHQLFVVDGAGGIIMVDGHVDREAKDKYLLNVIAKVGTVRPLSATTSVNIDILDRNDNPPEFSPSTAEVTIDGSFPVGKEIYRAAAADKDAGLNGVVHYQLTDDGSGLFKVNMTSGVISLARKVTNIDDSQYILRVLASDQGSPPLHTAFMLTVIIVTNHLPRFLSPMFTVNISRNLPVGKQILPITAFDPDSGDNGMVAYMIAPQGNIGGVFGISQEGILFVNNKLDQGSSVYTLSVTATDKGTPPLSSSASVTVNIQDSIMHQAMFVNDTFRFSVVENQVPGTIIGRLLLLSDNVFKHKKIVYSLTGIHRDFFIDSATAVITATRMFDREELIAQSGQNVITFLAKAAYSDTPSRQDTAVVAVTVEDQNDNVPIFRRSVVFVTVKESSQVGSIIYKVMASDPDEGVNANFTYAIVSGPSSKLFSINPVSGNLFLNCSLNREKVDYYNLTVQAVDVLNSTLYSQMCIEIFVGDVNDNRPNFTKKHLIVNASENLAVSSQIAVVHATDRDEGVNAEIAYTITSGNLEAVFDINHLTGEVFLIKPLDFERTNRYMLNITADDRGNPPLSAVSLLTVNVVDENDSPVFTDHPTILRIPENVTSGSQIGQCSANDKDNGENGRISFSIDSQTPLEEMAFDVNPDNCIITTRRQLDREHTSAYKLVIRATDSAHPESAQLSATKEITIMLEDVNDNKPIFVSVPAIAVVGNVAANSLVATILARDTDVGDNAKVTYNIISGDSSLFQLDPDTGQLATRSQLPNNRLSFQLRVSARDNGIPFHITETTVTVFKKGQPNSGPTFTKVIYRDSVEENVPLGTSVTRVQASFSPALPSAVIKYYITADSSNGSFAVNEDSGVIATSVELDRDVLLMTVFKLTVYAVDLSGPSVRTSSTTVEITLLDKNDNPPTFLQSIYRSTVKEMLPPGERVTVVSAFDKDEGLNAKVDYSITSGNDGVAFQVNGSTGEIITRKALNRTTQSKYTFNVTAADSGNPRQHSSCVVMVTVSDANNNVPQFSRPFYSFNVLEGTALGTILGQVAATDSDIGENARISFSIVDNHRDVFLMNPLSGNLKVAKRLDRETVEVYILNVSATDHGTPPMSSYSEVYVNVLDANDNAPEFSESAYSVSVSEATPQHSSIITVSVTDKDFGTNALVTYTILSGNSDQTFSVYPNGTIYNLRTFDREKKSSYSLTVMTRDQAMPVAKRLSSTTTVQVTITDINDNSPSFISSNITHVSEHAQTGDVVTAIMVTDPDVGSNSKITYSLVKLDPFAPFSLGAYDGVLRVSGRLDREVRASYVVKVIAADQGIPPKRAEMRLTIIVDDFNDHAPVFQAGMSTVPIFENITIGSEVARFLATDSDQGTNAEVRYSIATGNENGSFEINPLTGVLSTVRSLDRETKSNYTLVIRASDLGVPPQFSDENLKICLRDVNDNTPTFSQALYTASVYENRVEANVITVTAGDSDEGRDGALTYGIIYGNDGGVFTMDSQTGQIGLLTALDREQRAEYTLRVQAKDGGTPSRVGETFVTVKVTDENDNPPVFQPDVFKASVKENSRADTPVLRVTATDADAGSNGEISYSLTRTINLFKIDRNSGEITTTASLDREKTPFYDLKILATDGGNPTREATATLHVTVEDVNDFDPAFKSDRYIASVAPGSPPGTFIVMVSAEDNDIGVNAESQYTVPDGLSPVFQIAPKTGIITVAQNVPISPSSYSFTVKATNVNAPQRSHTTNVQITVAHGSFPVFQHHNQNVTVSELAPVGTKLITVNATGHTSYFIAAGNIGDVFEVDKVRGELSILNRLDFEQQTSYDVVIGARDGSSQPLSGFVTIHVTVTDENDNAPLFNQSVYRAEILEELPANSTVLWVHAPDADSGLNAEVEYRMVPADREASAAFVVSLKSGRVSTKLKLDRENISVYTFRVRAEDVANRSMASEAVVVVNVQDVNDNAPVFIDRLSVSVYENVSKGFQVAVLRATDDDTQQYAQLRFGFAAGGNTDGVFNLDPNNGSLTLQTTLDREVKSQYILEVTVRDSLHTTTANFTVTVLDVNDSPPRFASNPLIQKIREKLPVDAVAMNVTAFDDDVSTNAEILYSILPSPSRDVFTIDRQTGALRLNKVLVYKKSSGAGNNNLYNVTVKARNPYSPFFEETVHVMIEVTDTNDHSPVFKSSSYNFFAVISTPTGETVGRVEAIDDKDDGMNARVRYDVVSGNGSSLFNIDGGTGNVTIAGSVDTLGLFYLQVRAKDLGHPSKENKANVYVEVVEPNNNAPIFSLIQYEANPLETVSVGEVVVKVTASDRDMGTNGQVFYHIQSSDPPGYFGIGRTNGSIFVQKPLDYELTKLIELKVVAVDGGRIPRSNSVVVRIKVIDENDNHPVFTKQEYHGYIPENTAPGAPVVTVKAFDPDSGDGGRIEYSITSVGSLGLFEINQTSGEIRSKAEFDYEARELYELTVTATDHGNPQLASQPNAKVLVHVTSVNEYTPKFNRSLFTASVAENAPIGQSVTRIYATDKDKGPDGEVIFVLVGESNNQGFNLEHSTGVLSVSGGLDSERAGIVTLQVLAKNALQTSVTPETSDLATIIVTVTDANDAPRFLKSVYETSITEDATPGSFVANVTAVDDDFAKHPVASKIRYGILNGNIGNAFTIDSDTGRMTNVRKLDREAMPKYRLTVTATDHGRPPLSGNATVIVSIDDVNDNAPRLFANCTGTVKENELAGTHVMTLQPHDPDTDPNRGPYAFAFYGDNFGKFQLDSGSGLIKTTALLDREATSSYNLSIRISDNGSPQKSAVSYCNIVVLDKNDNRPGSTERVVHVNSNDSFPAGFVANVQPEDPDVNDTLVCKIIKNSDNLFSFPPGSCMLRTERRHPGSAELDLMVNSSDGKWAVSYKVQVRFVAFNSKTIDNSVTVRVQNTSPERFLSTSYQLFLNAINRVLQPGHVLQLFSVKSIGDGFVDLSVAAKSTQAFEYMTREDLSGLLRNHESDFERNGKIQIQNVDYTPCTASSPCRNGGECTSYIHTLGTYTTVESVSVIFLSVDYEWRFSCVCKPGFVGETCEVSEQGCNSKPCKNGATCIDKDNSFVCQCPTGFTGLTCGDDVNECVQNPCKNGGTCKNLVGSYQCDCKPGYLGKNCTSGFDFCRVSSSNWAQPKCTCASSQACQCACIGFESAAYLQLPTLESLQRGFFNNITFEFSTSKSNGLLLYNTDAHNKADSDFIAIQIIDGRIQMSFNLGSTGNPAVVKADTFVADGQWHRVTAIRDRQVCVCFLYTVYREIFNR